MNIYEERRKKIYSWLDEEDIALAVFEDCEERRDTTIRWLTGHPGDAVLFLSLAGESVLVPWDINLAKFLADSDVIVDYSEFERNAIKALRGAIKYLGAPVGTKIEIPSATPYPIFLNYVENFNDFDIVCRTGGVHQEAKELRAVKDDTEIKLYRHISEITNELISLVEDRITKGVLKTESSVALFLEAEALKRGCEGMGFEILAAGPKRSFGIHAFPPYTSEEFATQGLSILDFGVKYAGYTSDVTMTFACAPLSKAQEKMLSLTEKAYKLATGLAQNGASARLIGMEVNNFLKASKQKIPHGLGHGVGLSAHEYPLFHTRPDNLWVLKPGMIIAIEPGLYDHKHGGCRLENNLLIKESGSEVLTNSRIVMM